MIMVNAVIKDYINMDSEEEFRNTYKRISSDEYYEQRLTPLLLIPRIREAQIGHDLMLPVCRDD